MDPARGVVLGHAWGDAPRDPVGPATVVLLGVRWRVELLYELDALVAVGLALESPSSHDRPELTRSIGEAAQGWLGVPLEARDEAFWVAEVGATRLTWDGLDGRLVFEDTD